MDDKRYANTLRRHREMRDIYNQLRRKGYRSDRILEFITCNYFCDVGTVYLAIRNIDREPVQNPSLIHQTVMRDEFNL